MTETPITSWGAGRRPDGGIDLRLGALPPVVLSEQAAAGIADMLRSMTSRPDAIAAGGSDV